MSEATTEILAERPPKLGRLLQVAAAGGVDREFGIYLADLGRGTGPRGEKMAAACPGVDSRDLATILDPFRTIFVDFGAGRLLVSET